MLDAGGCAAMFLNVEPLRWAARFTDYIGDTFWLRVFATKSHRKYGAYIGMFPKGEHHSDGILVVITAWESDYMHVVISGANLMRHETSALYRINDENQIANSFAPIGAQIS